MTVLRTGFVFSKSTWTPPVNAAPSVDTVTLNFDFKVNAPPVGRNIGLSFEVERGNAAPIIAGVTLNFDNIENTPPIGQNQSLVFQVIP